MRKRFPWRKICSFFLGTPSRVLQEINSNALMTEWSQKNKTDNIFNHRFDLYEYVNTTILKNQSIDYLEFGVYKGVSLFKWAAIHKNENSLFYGFDSFAGLPSDWVRVFHTKPAKTFDAQGRVPVTNDERVHFVKGVFKDTLPIFLKSFDSERRLVVHNDSDIYSSTLYCLTMLDSFFTKGSILIFDEFYSSSHEFQAFYDYSRAFERQYHVLAAVGKDPYCQIAIEIE